MRVQTLMPPENMGQEEFGCPWQTISRLYELLAQVSAALGLNSVSALFYSLSVQSVMHLPPCASLHRLMCSFAACVPLFGCPY